MLDKRIIINAIKCERLLSRYALHQKPDASPIEIHDRIDSTNTFAMQIARAGVKDGTVVISEEQSGGRGRLGRSFFSPKGTGLYMSIVFRRRFDTEIMTRDIPALLTALAGVVAAQAIYELTGIDTRLKWVNDLYIDKKKVGGVLTEGSFKEDQLDFAVIGIGINVFAPAGGFPDDIKTTATALLPDSDHELDYYGLSPATQFPFEQSTRLLRDNLAGIIIGKLENWLDELEIDPKGTPKKLFSHYYEHFKWMVGEKVGVLDRISGNVKPFTVRGLTHNYELVVADDVKRTEMPDKSDNTIVSAYDNGNNRDQDKNDFSNHNIADDPQLLFLHSGDVIYFNSPDSKISEE